MPTYTKAKRTLQLLGGHICSKCKSVILTNFEFYTESDSGWMPHLAYKGVDSATEMGLKALQSFREKPFLVTRFSEDSGFTYTSRFGVEQLDHACPFCGNRERWQLDYAPASGFRLDPVSGFYMVKDVPEESRLTVFFSKAERDAWLANIMDDNLVDIAQYWKAHLDEAEIVRRQIHDLNRQIESLNAEKAAGQEELQRLHSKIESKEKELKSFSMFSSERKTAKTELNALKKQYSNQNATEFERKKNLAISIHRLENQIKELKISNFGVLGEVEMVTPNDAPYCQAVHLS